MSLTKSQYDAELINNEVEEQELTAMFYYELNRRQNLWFSTLPNLNEAEKNCYLQLPESHWFSPMFEAWMQVQNESKAIDAMLRPQIRLVDRNQLEDENIWTNIFSVDTEANRAELINRSGDI